MKNKINPIIIIFLLAIFISFSIPTIFSSPTIFDFKEPNPFLFQEFNSLGFNIFSQDFQASALASPSREGCTKAVRSDVFGSKKKFLFGGEKKQPVIHPTLEETNLMKINNEIKRKEEKMAKIPFNKTMPKMISQREIKKEKIKEKLGKDSEFREMYDYAKKLGYIKLNKSVEINYEGGLNATITALVSNNNSAIFILNNFFNNISQDSNCSKKSFLIKFGKINDTLTITMFDKEGGVVLDLLNGSIINEWGHHSCSYWICLGNCYSEIAPAIRYAFGCGSMCAVCFIALLDPLPVDEIICLGCLACMAIPAPLCAFDCLSPCAWYPCRDDCTEQNEEGPWEYYCKENERWKHKNYTAYKCEHNNPGVRGDCILDSYRSGWQNETCVPPCPCTYGCNQATGNCKDAITCYSDLDCGEDDWTGSPYCYGEDVYQYYKTYTCSNPGTESSSCGDDSNPTLKQECVSGDCEDGECVESESCGNPNFPWYCNEACWHCDGGDEDYSVCCPDSGDPDQCCNNDGPYCDTSTGDCDVCGGDYPDECNNQCWGCDTLEPGYEVCCPTSGDPQYCCDATDSVCMSDGSCCTPTTETCNNADDDCDGTIDNFNEGCGVGACAGGTKTCTAGSWGACSSAGNSTTETCNNVDDDCDGSVDESLSQGCGSDIGECVKCTQSCSAGQWENCTGSYVAPVNETCDGLDNNCNNITDEANVCGDYPNATLINPPDNHISYTGNITFNCSSADDNNLSNITLYHSISGNMSKNETKIITGTLNSTTWIINNIPNETNFLWNCRVFDKDSHWSWSKEGSYYVNVDIGNAPPTTPTFLLCNGTACIDNKTFYNNIGINCSGSTDNEGDDITYFIEGYSNHPGIIEINSFNNSLTEENLSFSGDENITRYLRINRYANVTSAYMNLSGWRINESNWPESLNEAVCNSNR